jgi:hypothetical protein
VQVVSFDSCSCVSILNTAGGIRLTLCPDIRVLVFTLIHIGRHDSIKHSMLRSMASPHGVGLLQVDNAQSTSVTKPGEIVALKTREMYRRMCVLLRFCYDSVWCAFQTPSKYFDAYQTQIKFKTFLYLTRSRRDQSVSAVFRISNCFLWKSSSPYVYSSFLFVCSVPTAATGRKPNCS